MPGAGAGAAGRGDEHYATGALRPDLREGLSDHAAEGVADDVRLADLQPVQQELDVVRKIEARVAALGLSTAVAPQVDQQAAEPP